MTLLHGADTKKMMGLGLRMNTVDNREILAKQLSEMLVKSYQSMNEALNQDKVMLIMDAVAVAAIDLKIKNWDKLTFSDLRFAIKSRQDEEKARIGIYKSETNGRV